MAGPLIFLTGGTGFLGRHLVPYLAAQGYRLRVLARPTTQVDWLSVYPVEVVRGDVLDPASLAAALPGCQQVVHAAGLFRFWGDDGQFWQTNVVGAENVLAAARAAGVARIVAISTIAVVGKVAPGEWITEESPCHPQDAYQRAKLGAEQVFRQGGLPVVILRPGAFYGPYSGYGFNRLFVGEPLRGWRIQVEHGRRLIFPVFVPDVAWAVGAVLASDLAGETLNICDDPVTHQAANQLVSRLAGISPWRWNAPRWLMLTFAGLLERLSRLTGREPFYPLNLQHYVFNDWRVSNAKARAQLGFVPTPLEVGLRQTIAWYRRKSDEAGYLR